MKLFNSSYDYCENILVDFPVSNSRDAMWNVYLKPVQSSDVMRHPSARKLQVNRYIYGNEFRSCGLHCSNRDAMWNVSLKPEQSSDVMKHPATRNLQVCRYANGYECGAVYCTVPDVKCEMFQNSAELWCNETFLNQGAASTLLRNKNKCKAEDCVVPEMHYEMFLSNQCKVLIYWDIPQPGRCKYVTTRIASMLQFQRRNVKYLSQTSAQL